MKLKKINTYKNLSFPNNYKIINYLKYLFLFAVFFNNLKISGASDHLIFPFKYHDNGGYYHNTFPNVLPQYAIDRWKLLINHESPSELTEERIRERDTLISALEESNIQALYSIGMKFKKNEYGNYKKGTAEYYDETEPWFWNAGIRGHSKSMHNYALLKYAQREYNEAYKWFFRAEINLLEPYTPSKRRREYMDSLLYLSKEEKSFIIEECKRYPLPTPLCLRFIWPTYKAFNYINEFNERRFQEKTTKDYLEEIISILPELPDHKSEVAREIFSSMENFKKGQINSLTVLGRTLMYSHIAFLKTYLDKINGQIDEYEYNSSYTCLFQQLTKLRYKLIPFEKIIGLMLIVKAAILGDTEAQEILVSESMRTGYNKPLFIGHLISHCTSLEENRLMSIHWLYKLKKNYEDSNNHEKLAEVFFKLGHIAELGTSINPYPLGFPCSYGGEYDFNYRVSYFAISLKFDQFHDLVIPHISRSDDLRNKNSSIPFYLKAAQLNNTYAMFKLASFYYYGEIVDKNESMALFLYLKILKLEDRWIDTIVGRIAWMYHIGCGTKRNEKFADHYYSKFYNYHTNVDGSVDFCIVKLATKMIIGYSIPQNFIEAERLLKSIPKVSSSLRYVYNNLIDLLDRRNLLETKIIEDLKLQTSIIPATDSEAIRLIGEFFKIRNTNVEKGLLPYIKATNQQEIDRLFNLFTEKNLIEEKKRDQCKEILFPS